MAEMPFTNFSSTMANSNFTILFIYFLASLEIFSQGFPLNKLELTDGSRFDYVMNYDVVTKISSDTIDNQYSIKYILDLPYSVRKTIPGEYQLNLISKDFNMKLQTQKRDDIVLNYQNISDSTGIDDPSKIFSSQINISDRGEIFEHITNSEYEPINEILNFIGSYSTGIFLEFPKDSNAKQWIIIKPILMENNGVNLKFSSTYTYTYQGVHEKQSTKYYKIDYELSNFRLDLTNELMAVYNRLMQINFDLNGYYLIDRKTGKTFQNYSEGSIRTIMDLGEFEALMTKEKQFKRSNLLMFQIAFKGNSYIR